MRAILSGTLGCTRRSCDNVLVGHSLLRTRRGSVGPGGLSSAEDFCIDYRENLFLARLGLVVGTVGVLAALAATAPASAATGVAFWTAKAVLGRAAVGLTTVGLAGYTGVVMKRQLNRCIIRNGGVLV